VKRDYPRALSWLLKGNEDYSSSNEKANSTCTNHLRAEKLACAPKAQHLQGRCLTRRTAFTTRMRALLVWLGERRCCLRCRGGFNTTSASYARAHYSIGRYPKLPSPQNKHLCPPVLVCPTSPPSVTVPCLKTRLNEASLPGKKPEW